MYNTSTAEKIEEWDNGCMISDPFYCSETLYRKKNGEFFLYIIAGFHSKYYERIGDSYREKIKKIIKLTDDQSKDWLAIKCFAETYEEIFGELEE